MSHPDIIVTFDGISLGPGMRCGWPAPELMIKRAVAEFPKIPFDIYVYQPEPKRRVLALFGPDSPSEFELGYSTEIRTHDDIDNLARQFYRFIMGVGQSLSPIESVPSSDG